MELIETIDLMLSGDHKERFKAEYNQLVIRTRKLKNIIDDYYNDRLKFELNTPINILEDQYKAMVTYCGILVKRAKLYEGISLEEVKR